MIYEAYSVYDKRSKIYALPMFLTNEEVAQRTFTMIMMNDDSLLAKFPDDYELRFIGRFNDVNGVFDADSIVTTMTGNEVSVIVSKGGVENNEQV